MFPFNTDHYRVSTADNWRPERNYCGLPTEGRYNFQFTCPTLSLIRFTHLGARFPVESPKDLHNAVVEARIEPLEFTQAVNSGQYRPLFRASVYMRLAAHTGGRSFHARLVYGYRFHSKETFKPLVVVEKEREGKEQGDTVVLSTHVDLDSRRLRKCITNAFATFHVEIMTT